MDLCALHVFEHDYGYQIYRLCKSSPISPAMGTREPATIAGPESRDTMFAELSSKRPPRSNRSFPASMKMAANHESQQGLHLAANQDHPSRRLRLRYSQRRISSRNSR
jgi:hypothetical protein